MNDLIADLADREAELLEQLAYVVAERDAYRLLAQTALTQLSAAQLRESQRTRRDAERRFEGNG